MNAPLVLQAKGLVKRYGQVTALDGADFELRAGEILAVIGDNGAGKSSLIKALSGATIPDEGEILLDGRPVSFRNPMDARREGIECCYQDLAVAPAMTIAENLFLGRELRREGFLGSALFGFVMARLGIKWPTALMLLIGAIGVAWFGMGRDSLSAWQVATMVTGFFTNAAISGYYAAFARGFPAYARGTGTGFVLGIGRLGAAGSPLIAGALFQALGNSELLTVSIIMAMGSIVSLVLFLMLPERDGDEVVGLTPGKEA